MCPPRPCNPRCPVGPTGPEPPRPLARWPCGGPASGRPRLSAWSPRHREAAGPSGSHAGPGRSGWAAGRRAADRLAPHRSVSAAAAWKPGARMQETPLVAGQGDPTPDFGHGTEGKREDKANPGGSPRAVRAPDCKQLALRRLLTHPVASACASALPQAQGPQPRPRARPCPPRAGHAPEPAPRATRPCSRFPVSRLVLLWLSFIESHLVRPQQTL